jgi:cytochrome c553
MKNWLIALVAGTALAMAGTVAAQGDAAAGKAKSAACAACHGADGNSTAPNFPKIASLGERYIIEQLQAFKDGARVNPLMTPIAKGLSEQDMADLAAYYSTQTMLPGGADEALVELGGDIYRGGIPGKNVPACAACHGPTGAGNPAAGYPQIGGQHAVYLAQALNQYKSGERKTGPAMTDIASKLTDEQIRAVASYASGLYRRQ